MDFLGIENITPYKNEVGFSIYKYDDEINIGDKENYLCDVRVVILDVEEPLIDKLGKERQAIVLVENYKVNNINTDFEGKLKKFIIEEVLIADLNKGNIDVIYIKK